MPANPWTKAEDERLKSMICAYTYAEIASKLNRTLYAVHNRARYLGICRIEGKSEKHAKKFAERAGISTRPGVIVHRIV